MKKLSIALVTGGDVAERGISLLSAKTVMDNLDSAKYEARIIDFQKGEFTDVKTRTTLDKSDFTLKLERKIHFDLVYPILHGSPAENGILQGYLALIGIPFTGSRYYEIPQAPSILIKAGQEIDRNAIEALKFPLFVKPNQNGSSYGISRINASSDILPAIEKAFQFDDEVLIETFIDGPEYSNGIYRKGEELIVLPITEIIPDSSVEFFDYAAKYENKSQEITPARLTPEQTKRCQAHTRLVYERLNCKGICRADYIMMNDEFYFLEINTIPGFSPNSLVPQQAKAIGLPISDMLDSVIEEALNKKVSA